jgi:hypothetical protein
MIHGIKGLGNVQGDKGCAAGWFRLVHPNGDVGDNSEDCCLRAAKWLIAMLIGRTGKGFCQKW